MPMGVWFCFTCVSISAAITSYDSMIPLTPPWSTAPFIAFSPPILLTAPGQMPPSLLHFEFFPPFLPSFPPSFFPPLLPSYLPPSIPPRLPSYFPSILLRRGR